MSPCALEIAHTVNLNEAAATMHQQALGWFDEHDAGTETAPRDAAGRVQLVGPQSWLDFDAWPPTTEVQKWNLGVGESLVPAYSAPPTATSRFVFNPTEPTPAVGGRLFMGAGRLDNAHPSPGRAGTARPLGPGVPREDQAMISFSG
jgi:predicted acyl esterase